MNIKTKNLPTISPSPDVRGYPECRYPSSWYRLAFGREIKKGQIKTVSYFGQEFLIFRSFTGKVSVVDPYCPHLGAHLGGGGKVEEESIRCPFHGWSFNGQGDCVDIPYCKKIPEKAKIQSYEVREVNGIIFLWFDRLGRAPVFEIPPMKPTFQKDWKYATTLSWVIETHIQEIIENGVDFPHFQKLHQFLDIPTPQAVRENGPTFHIQLETRRKLMGIEGRAQLETNYFGMGFYVTPVSAGKVQINTFMTPTPLDKKRVEVKLDVFFHRSYPWYKSWPTKKIVIKGIREDFERDIVVWEKKIYRERPQLVPGDGPIPKIRQWCEQFYSSGEEKRQ